MDAVTLQELQSLIQHSIQELRFQLTKGHRSLAAKKKKAYFRQITGTLLYDLSTLIGVKIFVFCVKTISFIKAEAFHH